MDDRRFDDLTRRLASGTSRRQVLKTLAGGAFAGVAGALGLGRVAAAACTSDADCARGETCDPATATCVRRGGGTRRPANQQQSVGIAAACTSDTECAPNETCVDSVCTPRGGGGQCVRGSACTSDATCCGGEVCDTLNGVCVGAGGPCTNVDGTCFDSTDCCGNEDCVAGVCQRTAGGCAPGAVCAVDAECCGGQVCTNGTCARAARPSGCPAGTFRCSGTCVDIQTDPTNCGACGVACSEGVACVGGTCLGSGELCGSGDTAVVCGPCEYCGGRSNNRCIPCGPENCRTCVAGVCQKLCTDCEVCSGSDLDGNGNPTCQPICPDPCTVCVFTEGETPFESGVSCDPVVACGRCEDLVQDENGICICVPRCTDPCTTCCCGLGEENNGDCTRCENIGLVCNETGTCVEPAA